jgi:hypothetical protein
MQEFESISASSYDPSSLATKLTAKAAEGWSVVAIVPTGGDVTAFVSRESGSNDAAATPADHVEAPVEAVVEEPAVVEAASAPEPEAISEPSGWAIAPEPATPTIPEVTSVQPTTTYEPAPSYQPATTYEPAPSYQPTPAYEPAPAAAPEPVAAPAVPAGWYADPAGRFELRYWDGSTWTEHVSRAGQQFTDPPVA